MSELSMIEAIQMAYHVQDIQRDTMIEYLMAKEGVALIGPSGRRGFESLDDIAIYMKNCEADILRMRNEIRAMKGEETISSLHEVAQTFKRITGRSSFFLPVTTVEELDTFNKDDIVNGYHAGTRNEPEPFHRGKAYWHGWRNGMIDKKHMPMDYAAEFLARAIVRSREKSPEQVEQEKLGYI